MEHLFADWKKVSEKLARKRLLVFLDYDGTLVPITDSPAKAIIPKGTITLLSKLSRNPCSTVAIISGRDIDDIKRMVSLPNIIYAGNHGCQISGPNVDWHYHFPSSWIKELRRLHKELSIAMREIPGVLLEDKNMSIAVHIRKVNHKDATRFQEILARISKPYIASLLIKPSIGKKVIELGLASAWNKGKAVNWLIHKLKRSKAIQSYLAVYIGDDVTDETAFRALKHKGITIRVGAGKQSAASYYLRNPLEVVTFLRKLTAIL